MWWVLPGRTTYPAGTRGRRKLYDPSVFFKVVAIARGWLYKSVGCINSTLKLSGSEETLLQEIVAFWLLFHPEGVVIK